MPMRMFPKSLRILVSLIIGLDPAIQCSAQEDFPVLTEEILEWTHLPTDLNRKVVPLADADDLRFKLGTTADGQQFLRIQPPRLKDLSFGVKLSEQEGSYIASSKRAIYWPRQHLLRLEKEIIVSSTHCDLKGETFDIHLHHDTARLEDPEEILLDEISLPIVSQGIRISGLGRNGIPDFEWDPVTEKNARSEQPTPIPTQVSVPTATPASPRASGGKQYDLHIGERWELGIDGEEIELEDLERKIEQIGREEPESSLLIQQSAAANPVQVRRVHDAIESAGIGKVKTTIVPSRLPQGELIPEVDPKPTDVDSVLPGLSEKGGRLLWVYEPGKYNLNGKDYTEPNLRQALRAYARRYGNLTLVIASSRPLPSNYLREFVRDIKAYGFKNILVGVEPETATR